MAAHARNARRARRNEIIARLRMPRVIADRENPLEVLSEEEVFRRYRFRPTTVLFILSVLPNLETRTRRSLPLPPLLQLLVTLGFLATGSVHLLVAESVRISRSTAGRCIRSVARHLSMLAGRFVKFPTGPAVDRTKRAFAAVAGFPNVLGCIDGTFIKVQRPSSDEQDYVNWKGVHALNVQMCCDPWYRVTSLNASWPGSVHDSRIFRQSELCAQFENGKIVTHPGDI